MTGEKKKGWSRSILWACLGPFAIDGWCGKLMGLGLTLFLTLLTQVGGLILWPFWCWVTARSADFSWPKRYGFRLLVLAGIYLGASQLVLPWVASQTGRVRLPMRATEALPTGPLNIGYALLNRNYVREHTYEAYTDAVRAFGAQHPGAVVRYLDAGFPFPMIPLLPHFSHGDGQRIDVAFLFEREGVTVDRALSPIGYWGYATESPVREECVGTRREWGPFSIDLRWDFEWLQPLWPELKLDVDKNRALFRALSSESRVCSILLEPTLHRLLAAPKLTKNGCRVARHDDHFHLTILKRCR